MKKLIMSIVLMHNVALSTQDTWVSHTYHNASDYPVEIVTYYTQVVQCIVQPKKRRKVRSKKIESSIKNTLNPHESKTILLTGDALSARRVIPGRITVFDSNNHDQTILPRYNVQDRDTFNICRNAKGKLKIHPAR